ncbi:MAG: hypothetical protein COV60_00400 [Candidatus Magasanikbacteria bacterium CG11_big_fil_rev_8_21_14_0_20_43_7]|uniref:Sugar 3,4-ketoisomerase QdtA cupin domain-containing protein n=1 Tax=Candidatus Magasanikbacteria bacterium CG11_big_fil_rev_8_21_14_0_20_43_7 TaxID=1974654 RepID=A0A2H0N3E9_9BACT|nr:MAG: hypothetical protein COV60_00400 [Candidatus Magasanikbacteria bacterium CG11_big_fil_rev_8_21_14_0_20_43_7]
MEKVFKQWELKTFSGKGYSLTPVEFKDVAPFEVKRMYYIIKFEDGVQTGEHCHIVEEEVFIQVQGSSTIIIDRGNGKEEIAFPEGSVVYVPNFVWHGFSHPSKDCVLMALSSTNYFPDRSDYVEDYNTYVVEYRARIGE